MGPWGLGVCGLPSKPYAGGVLRAVGSFVSRSTGIGLASMSPNSSNFLFKVLTEICHEEPLCQMQAVREKEKLGVVR